MIKVLLRADGHLIKLNGLDECIKAMAEEWSILPWIKYLQNNGKIISINQYHEVAQYTDTFVVCWDLPEEKETFFHVKYAEDREKILRLT